MSAFVVIAISMCAAAAAWLTRPLWHRQGPARAPAAVDEVDALSRQLGQLRELHAAGALTDEQYAQGKAVVERKVLTAVLEPRTESAVKRPLTRASARLGAALALFMAAIAGGGYWWIGSPAGVGVGPGTGSGVAAAGGTGGGPAHPLSVEKVTAMIDELVERLKTQPDDAAGWLMLARAYVAIGKHTQSVAAFKEAVRLRPDDADLLADYADALAVASNRSLEGEPAQLVERALKADPDHPKALALAGTAAFDRRDYKGAVAYWEHLAKVEPAGTPFAEQIRANIDEARQLAGMPAAAPPAVGDAASGAAAAQVSGIVTLSPALRARASPDDTLFVFARELGSQRMPLGILRKRVRDLPLQFRIDDSSAMSPEAKLSNATRVAVIARISKSGSAMAEPGDLQGMVATVAVGTSGVKIDIDQEVTK